MKKIYIILNTSEIIDWNPFIIDYLTYYEGSLLLNTFQGLFIVTGKNYSDLYYYSKKYSSISKLKSYIYNHKYGGLLLSPDNDNLIVVGGETKNIETLNFESSLIKNLPTLLNRRINSGYTFIANKLFAFFGKNDNTIEYLDMDICQKWEYIHYLKNINTNEKINIEGHVAIPANKNEILIIGGHQNNKVLSFNFNEESINYTNIYIPFIDKVGEYIFNKDKYFNAYIGNDNSEFDENDNSCIQLYGIDSMGNIHFFNKDFIYSIKLFDNNSV